MVVKTEPCSFSEYKIYPGRGQKFVGKDAKVHFFISAKVDSLFHQKIKQVKLTWSQAWRRMNKKGKLESAGRRKKGRAIKFQKAIVGMSLEDMKRKVNQKTDLRQAAKEQAKSEAKARQAKKSSAVKAQPPKQAKAAVKNTQQKQVKQKTHQQ